MINDIAFGAEDAVGQLSVTHELPDVLDGVQLGAFGRERHQRNVRWYDQLVQEIPSGLVDQQVPGSTAILGVTMGVKR